MTSQYIAHKIMENELLIQECVAERTTLENDEAEYEQLRSKVAQSKDSFLSQEMQRRNSAAQIANLPNSKTAEVYSTGMQQFLKGADYVRAVAGFDSAYQKVGKKLEENSNKIEAVCQRQKQLEAYQRQLYQQLAAAREAEALAAAQAAAAQTVT